MPIDKLLNDNILNLNENHLPILAYRIRIFLRFCSSEALRLLCKVPRWVPGSFLLPNWFSK